MREKMSGKKRERIVFVYDVSKRKKMSVQTTGDVEANVQSV